MDVCEIEEELESKKRLLSKLNNEIRTAESQNRRLKNFLERLGIDPLGYDLEISTPCLGDGITDDSGQIVAVEAEVDPLPFNSASDEPSHEF